METGINIEGVPAENIIALGESLVKVASVRADKKVIIKALEILEKGSNTHALITNCVVNGCDTGYKSKPKKKKQ